MLPTATAAVLLHELLAEARAGHRRRRVRALLGASPPSRAPSARPRTAPPKPCSTRSRAAAGAGCGTPRLG
eukprot:948583-Prymnesium_polylepis.1